MKDPRTIAAEERARLAQIASAMASIAKAFVGQPSLRAQTLAGVSRNALATWQAMHPAIEYRKPQITNPITAPVLASA